MTFKFSLCTSLDKGKTDAMLPDFFPVVKLYFTVQPTDLEKQFCKYTAVVFILAEVRKNESLMIDEIVEVFLWI